MLSCLEDLSKGFQMVISVDFVAQALRRWASTAPHNAAATCGSIKLSSELSSSSNQYFKIADGSFFSGNKA